MSVINEDERDDGWLCWCCDDDRPPTFDHVPDVLPAGEPCWVLCRQCEGLQSSGSAPLRCVTRDNAGQLVRYTGRPPALPEWAVKWRNEKLSKNFDAFFEEWCDEHDVYINYLACRLIDQAFSIRYLAVEGDDQGIVKRLRVLARPLEEAIDELRDLLGDARADALIDEALSPRGSRVVQGFTPRLSRRNLH